jgi:hypothetical protein
MMIDIICPFCNTEFEAKEWEYGECPNCKEKYWWEEVCTENFSDCWSEVFWDFEKLVNFCRE